MRKPLHLLFVILGISTFLTCGTLCAQDKGPEKAPEKKSWEFTIMPYVSTIGVNGNVGVDHLETHVNLPWHKLKSYVKTGYALSAEARYDRHGILFSGSYLKLDDDGSLRNAIAPDYVGATMEISNIELDYAYRVARSNAYTFDVFGGVRYWRFRADLDVGVPVFGLQASVSNTQQFYDPILGFIFTPRLTDKLSLIARGDLGGFGIGSHFTWRGQGAVNYQFTRHVGGQVGYTYTSINYTKNGFTADIDIQGAYAGMNFKF